MSVSFLFKITCVVGFSDQVFSDLVVTSVVFFAVAPSVVAVVVVVLVVVAVVVVVIVKLLLGVVFFLVVNILVSLVNTQDENRILLNAASMLVCNSLLRAFVRGCELR